MSSAQPRNILSISAPAELPGFICIDRGETLDSIILHHDEFKKLKFTLGQDSAEGAFITIPDPDVTSKNIRLVYAKQRNNQQEANKDALSLLNGIIDQAKTNELQHNRDMEATLPRLTLAEQLYRQSQYPTKSPGRE